jgi:hypothetical protein
MKWLFNLINKIPHPSPICRRIERRGDVDATVRASQVQHLRQLEPIHFLVSNADPQLRRLAGRFAAIAEFLFQNVIIVTVIAVAKLCANLYPIAGIADDTC